MSTAGLRAMLAADHVTHVPGVYDSASAALAVRAGHRAVHLSGAAISAIMLRRPGLDVTPATQIADRAAVLAPALDGVPLLADADIGYDSPEDAVWTALAYQRAGISGLRLGDDADAGRTVARIAALVEQAPEMVVIAEAAGHGLTATIERCRAYAAAGADAVLPAGVPEADLGRLHEALAGVPLVVSRSEAARGGRRRPDGELAALGVRLVLHPLAAVLAALRAASLTYRAIAEEGNAERVDRIPLPAFALLTDQGSHQPTPRPAPRSAPPDSRQPSPSAAPGPSSRPSERPSGQPSRQVDRWAPRWSGSRGDLGVDRIDT